MIKEDKIIGYVLLIIGIVLLLFAVAEMSAVYTGAASPPKLITISDVSWPTQDGSVVTLMQGDQISQLPNIFFWFLLMVFMLLAGGKIAQIGVSMLKDVKVEVKDVLTDSAAPQVEPQAEVPEPPPPAPVKKTRKTPPASEA